MEPATRKVISRSPSHTVRQIHLPLLQAQPVEADSALERDFVHIAAIYPFTQHIQHQPFRLIWPDRSYTPDFLVTFKDGSRLVIEVKPREKLSGYEELFQQSKYKLAAHGISFRVADDQHIHAQNRAANALLIRRYAKSTFSKDAVTALVSWLTDHPHGVGIADVIRQEGVSLPLVCYCIAAHQVTTSASLGISPSDRVFPIPSLQQGETHAVHFANWLDL
jgi:TnsA endonuclease N terminal